LPSSGLTALVATFSNPRRRVKEAGGGGRPSAVERRTDTAYVGALCSVCGHKAPFLNLERIAGRLEGVPAWLACSQGLAVREAVLVTGPLGREQEVQMFKSSRRQAILADRRDVPGLTRVLDPDEAHDLGSRPHGGGQR